MKLLITRHQLIGGDYFNIIPIDESYPNELAEFGGNKAIEVTEELGQELLRRQSDFIKLQIELSLNFVGKEDEANKN